MWKRSSTASPARDAPPEGDALAELGRRAQAGEREATNRLLAAVAPALLRVTRQILGTHDADVKDATQEAAIALLRALPGFRGECTLLHFACRVAVPTAMNARRKRTSEANEARDFGALAERAERSTPEQRAQDEQCVRAVRELLESLPEALALHHVVGMTADEIARVTRAPLETVRSRLKLGRRALRARWRAGVERAAPLAAAAGGFGRRRLRVVGRAALSPGNADRAPLGGARRFRARAARAGRRRGLACPA